MRQRAALGLCALLSLAGCPRKGDAPKTRATPAAASAVLAVGLPPLRLEPQATLRVGLPQGCELLERPTGAKVGDKAFFFAPDEPRGELLLVQPGDPLRAGVALASGAEPRRLAAVDPERPPLFAAAEGGWWRFHTSPGGVGQALIGAEAEAPVVLLEGDGVEAIDLRCRGGRCAALSTRAMRVAAGGATLLRGAGAPSTWKRADYTPERAAAERPFVVAGIDGDRVTATTSSEEGVQFFEARGADEAATPTAFVAAPFGALEAIVLKKPVVIAHGAKLDGECASPRPALALLREGASRVIPIEAPPLSVFARPLTRGAFVSWLVPTHCGDRHRRLAYAALLDDEGELKAGPMAIANATGVGLSTSGDRVDLWLRQGERVTWLKMRCSPPP